MSSIAQGLEVEGEQPAAGDLSSTTDFMASLAADLGEEPKPVGGDESVAPEAAPATDAGTTPPDETDSSTADGAYDPEEKELKNLHSVLARQAAELGELRKQAAEREAEVEPEPEEETYSPPGPISFEVIEQINEALESQPGEQLAAWSLINAPYLYETILDTWAEQGLPQARRAAEFNMRYTFALQAQEAEQAAAEATEFQAGLASALDQQVAALAPEFGIEAGTKETDDLLAETIGQVPPSVQKLVVSKDPSEREDGLRVVLALASAKTATTSAESGAAGKALQDALEASKGSAAVGVGALRAAPPASEGGGEQPVVFLDAFEEALKKTPTTSVSEGLTFGSK